MRSSVRGHQLRGHLQPGARSRSCMRRLVTARSPSQQSETIVAFVRWYSRLHSHPTLCRWLQSHSLCLPVCLPVSLHACCHALTSPADVNNRKLLQNSRVGASTRSQAGTGQAIKQTVKTAQRGGGSTANTKAATTTGTVAATVRPDDELAHVHCLPVVLSACP
jgi:hypothetical protein